MKTQILRIAIAIFCLGISSCNNSATKTTTEPTQTTASTTTDSVSSDNSSTDSNEASTTKETDIYANEKPKTKQTTTPNKTNNKSNDTNQPKVGTIKEMVSGDLKCYVTLTDEKGAEHQLGATFEICEQQKLLNQKVNLTYANLKVNDCQSAEPCGKTKIESLISKIEPAGDKSSTTSNLNDTTTISNKEWTITIGNGKSWLGVNGTGNLSYRGCDSKGKCLELTGGKVTCRDGICVTGWKNGDYTYVVKQPITENGTPNDASSTTLEVRNNDKIILTATGFKTVN